MNFLDEYLSLFTIFVLITLLFLLLSQRFGHFFLRSRDAWQIKKNKTKKQLTKTNKQKKTEILKVVKIVIVK